MMRAFALSCLLVAPAVSLAETTHAVLVGVGDYLHLDADLNGPPHDVSLMAETLIARGVAADRIIALGAATLPAGARGGVPTRQGILTAMADAAQAAQPGDTVVFYFSGHGAQAPDTSGDEGGGYDEILLPADADKWVGAVGMVENALLDDELADWARPLLARGVRLVGIIDACHSATGFRAIGGQGVARSLDAAALAMPDPAGDAPAPGVARDDLEGEFVFLYSSQSDQRSFEYPYGDGTVWHGEFTLRLAQVLTEAPQASWAQVLAATTEAMLQGPARQQPDAEGPLLSAPEFGHGQARARHAVDGATLSAGFLHGLSIGTELAFYPAAAGGEPTGQARITAVEARRATLSEPAPPGHWAEVIADPAPDLRLAAPVIADDGDYTAWLAALPSPGAGPADLVPILTGGTVALALGDGRLDPEGPGSSPRITAEPGETEAEAVTRVLTQAAHALRLRSLLAGGPSKARTLTARPVLALEMERRPALPLAGACGDPGPAEPLEAGEPLGDCDQLFLTVTNQSGKAQDVSILYLAADFSITAIWPKRQMSNRLAMGERLRTGLQITPGTAPAREELWVIAVPVEKDAPRNDLTALATPEVTRAAPLPAGTAGAWFDSRLRATDAVDTTRGFALRPPDYALIRHVLQITP